MKFVLIVFYNNYSPLLRFGKIPCDIFEKLSAVLLHGHNIFYIIFTGFDKKKNDLIVIIFAVRIRFDVDTKYGIFMDSFFICQNYILGFGRLFRVSKS